MSDRIIANYYKIVSPASIRFDIMVFNHLIYHFLLLAVDYLQSFFQWQYRYLKRLYFLHYYPLVRKIIRCKRNFSGRTAVERMVYRYNILYCLQSYSCSHRKHLKRLTYFILLLGRGVFINIFDTISNGCYILFS
jgi:hypothetical protein